MTRITDATNLNLRVAFDWTAAGWFNCSTVTVLPTLQLNMIPQEEIMNLAAYVHGGGILGHE